MREAQTVPEGETGFDRVLAWLHRGDPDGEVSAAYLAKELLRQVYGAADPMQAAVADAGAGED